jgi:hypothetical protein
MSCCSLQPTCYGSYAIIDKINHLLDLSLSLLRGMRSHQLFSTWENLHRWETIRKVQSLTLVQDLFFSFSLRWMQLWTKIASTLPKQDVIDHGTPSNTVSFVSSTSVRPIQHVLWLRYVVEKTNLLVVNAFTNITNSTIYIYIYSYLCDLETKAKHEYIDDH